MEIPSPLIGIITAIFVYLFIGHAACGILPNQRSSPCLLQWGMQSSVGHAVLSGACSPKRCTAREAPSPSLNLSPA